MNDAAAAIGVTRKLPVALVGTDDEQGECGRTGLDAAALTMVVVAVFVVGCCDGDAHAMGVIDTFCKRLWCCRWALELCFSDSSRADVVDATTHLDVLAGNAVVAACVGTISPPLPLPPMVVEGSSLAARAKECAGEKR